MISNSILVVSNSHSIREMLARYLHSSEISIYTAESIHVALKYIKNLHLNVVIIDLELKDCSGLDLMVWLHQNHPQMHTVIMSDVNDSELKAVLNAKQSSYLDKNKLNLSHFRNRLYTMCRYPRGITYKFHQINLFEMVQLASHSDQARNVYITCPRSNREGMVGFQKGHVQYATYGEYNGEDAFYHIMKMKQGLFKETENDFTEKDSIEATLRQLISTSAIKIGEQEQENLQSTPTHCTILSPDMGFGEYLLKAFPSVDIELYWTDKEAEALSEIKDNSDLLILDLDIPDLDINALLEKIAQHQVEIRVILVGSQLNNHLQTHLNHPLVDRFFLKPMQFKELGELINQTYFSQQFEGQLMNLSLFNVLQTLSNYQQPRFLEVTDFFSGESGQIFIFDGELQYAAFGELSNRDALKAMMHIKYGLFRQETYWRPVVKTQPIPFQRMMIYLSRFLTPQPSPYAHARDLLLYNDHTITMHPDKIHYILATLGNQL